MTLFSHFGILNTFQRQEEQYFKKNTTEMIFRKCIT